MACLAIAFLAAGARPIAQKAKTEVKLGEKTPREAAVPFRLGEKLDYRVAWAGFSSAASIELTVPERRELMGWGTWHFRALAHTLSPMRSVISIDDQFDSYTDATTLESRQYETYLSEMGQKQNQIFHFQAEGHPPDGRTGGVVVSPGTRDPLGALFALRGVDWNRTPEFRAPVFDGADVYDMHVRMVVADEAVAVPAGNFSVSKISISLFQHGREVTGRNFTAYLANGKARTPVMLLAEMPLGNFRVELVSALE